MSSKSFKEINPLEPVHSQVEPQEEERIIDWKLCILCQEQKNESLQCPTKSKRKDTGAGYRSTAENVQRFDDLGMTPFDHPTAENRGTERDTPVLDATVQAEKRVAPLPMTFYNVPPAALHVKDPLVPKVPNAVDLTETAVSDSGKEVEYKWLDKNKAYGKYLETLDSNANPLQFANWTETKCEEHPQFLYWCRVLTLELCVLQLFLSLS
ncbi:hypothetical protein OS493_006968 [Desmophyllum pertusum]|uniref:Uncharacterized protein n=1 Tax=Desmophyllum pertusum TaxID=174260 RepID=A0A9W9ZHJ1_9CNID|nr:hypothetical protein OS493_006968 [Desmophyllum pertusum]